MIKCVTFDSGWARWCWCWCWSGSGSRVGVGCSGNGDFTSSLRRRWATSLSVRQRGTCGIGEGIPNVGMAVVVRFGLLCFSELLLFGSDERRLDCVYFYQCTVYRNTGYYCRNAQRTHNTTWFQSYKELTIHRSLYLLCLLCTSGRFVSSFLPHPSHSSEWNQTRPDQIDI
jgi:hypothetical protein